MVYMLAKLLVMVFMLKKTETEIVMFLLTGQQLEQEKDMKMV